jgi:hypothetical protein
VVSYKELTKARLSSAVVYEQTEERCSGMHLITPCLERHLAAAPRKPTASPLEMKIEPGGKDLMLKNVGWHPLKSPRPNASASILLNLIGKFSLPSIRRLMSEGYAASLPFLSLRNIHINVSAIVSRSFIIHFGEYASRHRAILPQDGTAHLIHFKYH